MGLGNAFGELQHCNTATARAEPSLLELCRVPAVVDEVNTATLLFQLFRTEKKIKNSLIFYRRPQRKCRTFALRNQREICT